LDAGLLLLLLLLLLLHCGEGPLKGEKTKHPGIVHLHRAEVQLQSVRLVVPSCNAGAVPGAIKKIEASGAKHCICTAVA
jgi:hypothetical protein